MNKIVRDHYPISRLPADLRADLPSDGEVRITLEVAETDSQADEPDVARQGALSRFKHVRRNTYASMEEIVAHVRTLRDEWSDRER